MWTSFLAYMKSLEVRRQTEISGSEPDIKNQIISYSAEKQKSQEEMEKAWTSALR